MNTKVNVRWSNQVKFITVLVTILLISTEVGLIYNGASGLIIISIALVFFVFMLSAPLSITLSDSKLILNKVFGKITINYSQIYLVKPYNPASGDIRVFGSGGFGGYVGIFSNQEIGQYFSYVGDPKQAFLIRTKNGKNYVFSCENMAFIIETVKKYLP